MVYYTSHYVIDWNKVQTLEDVKNILKAVNISFEPNYPDMALIQDYVISQPKQIKAVPL